MKELVVTVKGGRIYNRNESVKLFHSLPDGDYRMTIEPHRVRSLSQNDYYWGTVVPMVKKGLVDVGFDNVKNDTDAHQVMKEKFLADHVADAELLESLEKKKLTTTTLSTIQFTTYLEAIFQWAAEYLNVIIPSPISTK